MINWLKARCTVCGYEYEYPEGQYRPKTCSNFYCVWSYLHNPNTYKTLQERIEESRLKAKI